MRCQFAHHDGAFVLGALSPAERSAYQTHLTGCAECSRAVQELAGLPGLLARVPADVLESTRVDEPVPDTLLPALARRAQRIRSRRRRVSTGLAAAAASAIVLGSLGISAVVRDEGPGAASPPTATSTLTGQAGRVMVPLGSGALSARLAMTSVAWGTAIDLTCTYRSRDGHYPATWAGSYAMFVRTRDGQVEQVASWRALPGKTMRLAAATATSQEDIASVEIQTAQGKPVLRLLS
jgi:anti-sigma factor RsiW